MTEDLVVRLLAAISEVEKAAHKASGDWERQGPATGEHWRWVRSGHYDPMVDEAVDLNMEAPTAEFIADGNPVSLQSVEEYPTEYVGPLPHFVVNGAEEMARAPARHIVFHDPASVLRLCQAHRQIIDMHRPDPAEPYSWGGQRCSTCSCRGEECIVQIVDYPCPTLLALAEGLGVKEASDGE